MKKKLQIINNYFFKNKRLELGFTQQEVANILNCSISTIQKIEQDYNYFYSCKFSFILLYFSLLKIDFVSFKNLYNGYKDLEVLTK